MFVVLESKQLKVKGYAGLAATNLGLAANMFNQFEPHIPHSNCHPQRLSRVAMMLPRVRRA